MAPMHLGLKNRPFVHLTLTNNFEGTHLFCRMKSLCIPFY